MIHAVSEIGTPENALALVYAGLSAAVVWGLVLGGAVAWLSTVVRGGGKTTD